MVRLPQNCRGRDPYLKTRPPQSRRSSQGIARYARPVRRPPLRPLHSGIDRHAGRHCQ